LPAKAATICFGHLKSFGLGYYTPEQKIEVERKRTEAAEARKKAAAAAAQAAKAAAEAKRAAESSGVLAATPTGTSADGKNASWKLDEAEALCSQYHGTMPESPLGSNRISPRLRYEAQKTTEALRRTEAHFCLRRKIVRQEVRPGDAQIPQARTEGRGLQ